MPLLKKKKRWKRELRKIRNAPPLPPTFPIEMVTIGSPGNAVDPGNLFQPDQYGAVAVDFQIGKYEVTLDQYAVFLNAIAKSDPNFVYRSEMSTDARVRGIRRTGSSGDYTYEVIGNGRRPVTYVSWLSALRFCNWLHNGQPEGDQDASTTEDGAYELVPGDDFPARKAGAMYFLPSVDEWYKAAYFDPRDELSGGPPGGDSYWAYPTMSDDVPGNLIGARANQANYRTSNPVRYSVTQESLIDNSKNYLTPVGCYPGSPGPWGTYDMGGNVAEWTEGTLTNSVSTYRLMLGSDWGQTSTIMRSSNFGSTVLSTFSRGIGVRVASPVPDP